MIASPDDANAPGVYAQDADGRRVCVHAFDDADYALADIVKTFQLGRLEPAPGSEETVLVLTARELHQLKTMADAYSFDFDEAFIEMCHALAQFAAGQEREQFRFTSDF